MKRLGLLLFILCAFAGGAFAQVTVEVVPEQDAFLPSEDVALAVRITNRSGQTLHLGKEADWLTFSVESREGFIVLKSGEVPVAQEFDLESSHVAIKHVNIAPYFNLNRPGRYTVTAAVKIKNWNSTVSSSHQPFEVARGVKLWEQEFGVPPASPAATGQPEVRKYTLQKAVFRNNMKLYLRLSDSPETQVYKVFPIGPMVSFSRPEPQLDRVSNFHLIYQTGSHTFLYTLINPQGEVLRRETYEYATTRPRLKMDDDGQITVQGGVRRIAENDIPPSGVLPLTNVVPPAKP